MSLGILVTGAAGFIGRHVVELAAKRGHSVTAVDCFLPDSYDPDIKRIAWATLEALPGVTRHELDLREGVPTDILEGIDVVINEAAMPGLTKSWQDFELYSSCNTLLVSNLLDACLAAEVPYFVQASTSSVYGLEAVTDEDGPTAPISPYGVTKLAAEHLLLAYARTSPIDVCILRYFSVFGPGQRPDMAYHRFIDAVAKGTPIELYGDGSQSRTNTYVTDVARATVLAAELQPASSIMNISGQEERSVIEALRFIESTLGSKADIIFSKPAKGDQQRTRGDFRRATALLGYEPEVAVFQGLRNQIAHQTGLVLN